MAYTEIDADQYDPESPITTGLMDLIINNPMEDDYPLGSGVVKQGNLETTTGSTSLTATVSGTQRNDAVVTAPGGQYIMSYQSSSSFSDADADSAHISVALVGHVAAIANTTAGDLQNYYLLHAGNLTSSSFKVNHNVPQASNVYLLAGVAAGDSADSQTTTMLTSYIQASPPYDLGDGVVAGFVYALMNPAGDVIGLWCAEDPPWHGNTRHSYRQTRKGKAIFKRRKHTLDDLKAKRCSATEYLDSFEIEERTLTNADKLIGMDDLPQPFRQTSVAGATPVLLDPMSELTRRVIVEMKNGGSPQDIFYQGYVSVDNSPSKRSAPSGVMTVSFNLKSTRA